MNHLLFNRSTGCFSPQALAQFQSTQLIHGVQPSPTQCFAGEEEEYVVKENDPHEIVDSGLSHKIWAHQSGVNAIVIDRFEGRLLLSGGADSSIKVWDLQGLEPLSQPTILKPKGVVSKTATTHKYGITQLNFYPFDTAAFLSSSYDHTLKLYGTDRLTVSASFDLDSIIYTHALSPIASHLLVACASQHPAIRLVDLRSGSSAHSLAGHHGAVLAVAWSPVKEYVLASGGIDGTARIWDVRKSTGTLGLLDMEDSVGITGYDGMGLGASSRTSSKAHNGAVNGLSWTDDGAYIISAGHDEHIRVWDSETGSNTLASFGPTLKNTHLSTLSLLPSPTSLTPPGKGVLFYPNEHEILMFELHEGRLLKRMRAPGPVAAAVRSRTGERNLRNRVTSLTWRGVVEGIYSGHSNGQIKAWVPRSMDDDVADAEEAQLGLRSLDSVEESNKRKRDVLEDVFRDLTKQKITFG